MDFTLPTMNPIEKSSSSPAPEAPAADAPAPRAMSAVEANKRYGEDAIAKWAREKRERDEGSTDAASKASTEAKDLAAGVHPIQRQNVASDDRGLNHEAGEVQQPSPTVD